MWKNRWKSARLLKRHRQDLGKTCFVLFLSFCSQRLGPRKFGKIWHWHFRITCITCDFKKKRKQQICAAAQASEPRCDDNLFCLVCAGSESSVTHTCAHTHAGTHAHAKQRRYAHVHARGPTHANAQRTRNCNHTDLWRTDFEISYHCEDCWTAGLLRTGLLSNAFENNRDYEVSKALLWTEFVITAFVMHCFGLQSGSNLLVINCDYDNFEAMLCI